MGASTLAAFLSGAAAGEPFVRDEAVIDLVEILSDRRARSEQPVSVRKRLVDLGPEATAAVFDLLAGRVQGLGPGANLDLESRALLYDVMRSWPASEVAARIESRLDAGSPLGERLVALRLLGEVGDASAVPVVTGIVASFDEKEARPVQVRTTIETTLRRILIRDRTAYGAVSELVDVVQDHHLPPIVAALGEGGAARGQPILERLLDRGKELDLLVLEAMSKMDRWDPDADFERCAWVVRGHLDAQDPLYRRQAAVSLGRLRDGESVEDLIEALDDDDRRVRRGALWALHEITSLRFTGDQQRWLAWHAEQAAWFDSRSAELARTVQAGDPGPAVAALREIGEHPLYARDLVADVAPGLRHESPKVVAYACGILAQLGDPRAFALLVEALEDDRSEVRASAARCLEVLTGQSLPAEPGAWTDWAEGGKAASPRG